MKKQIIKVISLRFLMAAATLATAANAMAAGTESPVRRPNTTIGIDSMTIMKPEVKYLGFNDDYFYFEIRIENPTASKMDIVLTDKFTKNTLFTESFTAQRYIKKVAVPRDNLQLQWDITNKSLKGKTSERTYSLSTEVKLKEEVQVTKL